MSRPFKMKGSPMKRNFGIGASPAKQSSFDMKGSGDFGTSKQSEFKKMGTLGARPQSEEGPSDKFDWKSEKPENRPDWSYTPKKKKKI